MNWKDVTVWQFQQLEKLKQMEDLTDADIAVKACAIMYDMTEQQVDSLNLEDLNELSKGLSFLSTEQIPHAPENFITVNGRRYACIYDLRQLKAGRYLEAKTYGGDVIGNLHKIAASMIQPLRRTWYGAWKKVDYDAAMHEAYATDMLAAPFVTVYNSVLFFCAVYAKTMNDVRFSLAEPDSPTMAALEVMVADLCRLSGGFFSLP